MSDFLDEEHESGTFMYTGGAEFQQQIHLNYHDEEDDEGDNSSTDLNLVTK